MSSRKRKKGQITVGDHALMRFIERVHGVDLEFVRDQIRGITEDAINSGATSLNVADFEYKLEPKTRSVITVIDKRR